MDRKRAVDGRTVEVVLSPTDGGMLPRWAPGAHVDLVLPGGLVRPYSLCGDPDDGLTWRLLVRRGARARPGGASAYVHDRLGVGDRVHARGPRDRFPLAAAGRYLFLASGVGLAPLLPMVRRVDGARVYPWTLVHLEPAGGRSPLGEEVRSLGPSATTAESLAEVAAAVRTAPAGTAVHVCGGARFVDAVESLSQAQPGLDLHQQRFDAGPRTDAGGAAYELVLARRGDRIPVATGVPLLEALLDAGVDVPSSCGSGVCGACVVRVLAGSVRHRDAVLTEAERASGEVVTCVSAPASAELVLDL